MARSKAEKKSNIYFSQDVEDAIIEYNDPDTKYVRKCKIYREHIYPALNKLVENIIHTGKFYNFESSYEDTKHQVVAELTKKLNKFSPERGKAFSFLTMSCRNYLISYNKKVYSKKIKNEDLEVVDSDRDLNMEYYRQDYVETLSDFIDQWQEVVTNNLEDMFNSPSEIIIADSILEMFRSRENLDFFNKKALYILIKERSKISDTNQITSIIKVLKEDFYKNYNKYLSNSN
jgi:hypothetical protein